MRPMTERANAAENAYQAEAHMLHVRFFHLIGGDRHTCFDVLLHLLAGRQVRQGYADRPALAKTIGIYVLDDIGQCVCREWFGRQICDCGTSASLPPAALARKWLEQSQSPCHLWLAVPCKYVGRLQRSARRREGSNTRCLGPCQIVGMAAWVAGMDLLR